MAIRMHYFRGGRPVSSQRKLMGPNFRIGSSRPGRRTGGWRAAAVALTALILLPALTWGQYPGQIKKPSKDTPDLRAIAVLEWTGELGKPKACRMIPVTVFDGEKLQDASIYLARPQPLALTGKWNTS